ncbi:MAG TPA: hypothetical protein VFK50_01955 [Sphingomicrobium sp.]|nr:hypothetical protein [Sphingomicrobium sp.]
MSLLAIRAFAAGAQPAAAPSQPIIDMHLHARPAKYVGDNPFPMCAPFDLYPRGDPKHGIYEGMEWNGTPCANPIPVAATDDAVLRETITELEKNNIFGVVSGDDAGN